MDDDKFKLLIEFIFENAFRKGYKKGLKRGISIGSHQAYNKFVKHGHWVKRNTIGSATCSECDGVIYNAYDKSANKFCHVCGAKMEGDGK